MQFQSRHDTKTNGRPVFLAKARFSKVATLEPGGVFKECDVHIVQSLEIPLFQMDAISANY